MSPLPDASEITVPKDPSAYRRRHLLGLTFWAMLVMELLCVLAGVAVADYGPRFFRPKPVPRSAIVTSATAETAAATPTPAAAPAPATTPNAPLPDVARLNARLDSLEAQQTHASQVAAAALAASAVVEAAQGTGPFADELLSLRAISAPLPELQALTRVAQAAAPSRTALATSFPDYAASAASAARQPGDKVGLGNRIVYELSRIISLRRVGELPGDGVDAVLALAERQLEDDNLDRAFHTLDRLPAGASEPAAGWRGRAERRAEIDRNAVALRARVLQALTNEARGGG